MTSRLNASANQAYLAKLLSLVITGTQVLLKRAKRLPFGGVLQPGFGAPLLKPDNFNGFDEKAVEIFNRAACLSVSGDMSAYNLIDLHARVLRQLVYHFQCLIRNFH